MSAIREILERHSETVGNIRIERLVANQFEDADVEQFNTEYMVISGSAASFKFLASVLNEFAAGTQGCTWGFHPQGAGAAHFEKDTEIGFYLKLKPCEDGATNAHA